MTSEKAIKFFEEQHKSPAYFISLDEWRDYNDALDMAINALGAIQLKDLGYSLGEKPRTDGDIVSRQQAIDALWKALYEYEDKTEKQFQDSDELNLSDWILHRIFVQNMSDIDRQTILQLPSVKTSNSSEFPNNSDTVSKQAVLETVESELIGNLGITEQVIAENIVNDVCAKIRQLPSVEPKTGRWIDIDSETYTWKIRCDKCGYERSMMSTQGVYPRFCEGCGFKMEVQHGKAD